MCWQTPLFPLGGLQRVEFLAFGWLPTLVRRLYGLLCLVMTHLMRLEVSLFWLRLKVSVTWASDLGVKDILLRTSTKHC